MARINHTPDPNPTRAKARARRNLTLVVWWGVALLLLFLLSTGAPWVLVIPLLVIGALVITNTIQVVRGEGAEMELTTTNSTGVGMYRVKAKLPVTL